MTAGLFSILLVRRILDSDGSSRVTVPCDPSVMGATACSPVFGAMENFNDFPMRSPDVSPPTDGIPYGGHVTVQEGGYIFSWQSGAAQVGPITSIPDQVPPKAHVYVGLRGGQYSQSFVGFCVKYLRKYSGNSNAASYNYLSPFLCHVHVKGRRPNKNTATDERCATVDLVMCVAVIPLCPSVTMKIAHGDARTHSPEGAS